MMSYFQAPCVQIVASIKFLIDLQMAFSVDMLFLIEGVQLKYLGKS